MSETTERYEIREEIGKGGAGIVYRAYDNKLKREVALKRVITDVSKEQRQDAIDSLAKETGALSALQHPHIVTIFDSGVDDSGPYVVMQYIKGRNIDEMVEEGILTWYDFQEVAMQSQEALIAAQDLDLVHRDLKPSNIMVKWLPSGKFQLILLDFGLAKFSHVPSPQTINQSDSVLGSIHFMAPEQFERTPLDVRADMYSLGCLYYYSLTGEYPFDGETSPQVMAAHLNHTVKDLKEVRPDIPAWAADWVMWHLNRYPDDRPENARVALENFINNENTTIMSDVAPTNPEENTPSPEAPSAPVEIAPKPKLVFPGAVNADTSTVKLDTSSLEAPAPPTPPVPPVAEIVSPTPETPEAPPEIVEAPPQAVTPPPLKIAKPLTAPAPAAPLASPPPTPAAASTLAPATIPLDVQPPAATPSVALAATPPAPPSQEPENAPAPLPKSGMSGGVKTAIGSLAGLGIIGLVLLIISMNKSNNETKLYNNWVNKAKDPSAETVETSSQEITSILQVASSVQGATGSEREVIYQGLTKAETTDGGNIDKAIFANAISTNINSDIREKLFEVLSRRKNSTVTADLIKYAETAEKPKFAKAAIKAAAKTASDKDFPALLQLLAYNKDVRSESANALASLLEKSTSKDKLAGNLHQAYNSATDDDVKRSYLTLLGYTGGKESLKLIQEIIKSDDDLSKDRAITAMAKWPDDGAFETLISLTTDGQSNKIKSKAFSQAYNFLLIPGRDRKPKDTQNYWKTLTKQAQGDAQKKQIIRAMVNIAQEKNTLQWTSGIVALFKTSEHSETVQDYAHRAQEKIKASGKKSN